MAQKRSKKIDWVKAMSAYIGDKNLSLKEVAKRFSVSEDYIRKVSVKENWVEKKKKHWSNAEEKALEKVEGSMEELIIRHAKVARFLQASGLKYLKLILDEVEDLMRAGKVEEARAKIKQLILNKIITDSYILLK